MPWGRGLPFANGTESFFPITLNERSDVFSLFLGMVLVECANNLGLQELDHSSAQLRRWLLRRMVVHCVASGESGCVVARTIWTNQGLTAICWVTAIRQHAMEVAEVRFLMPNSLFLRTLANIEREFFAEFWRTSHSSFCASLTACALPPATIALSHHAEGLRRTADDSGRVPRSLHKQKRLQLHFDVADDTLLGMLNWSFVHGNMIEPHGQAGFGQHQPLPRTNRYLYRFTCWLTLTWHFKENAPFTTFAGALGSSFAGGTIDRPACRTSKWDEPWRALTPFGQTGGVSWRADARLSHAQDESLGGAQHPASNSLYWQPRHNEHANRGSTMTGCESVGSTSTNITFGKRIDGDMYKLTDSHSLKRSRQVTKPRGSHHYFVEMTADTV